MPDLNSILLTLNLKEPNIRFDDNYVFQEKIKGVESLVFSGTLTCEPPSYCPICGCQCHDASIVKNGTKTSRITLPEMSRMNTYLRLRKQRFLCRDCRHTFTAKTDIVSENCFISENTKLCVIIDSKKKLSQQDIAQSLNVSHGTVNRILMNTYKDFVVKKNYLPRHLCFDEFKSVKKSKGHMSFIFMNADTGDVIDVLEDRKLNALIRYFNTYTRPARNAVETICMDIYTPYMELVKAMFPNARIILDRFHIIQQLTRSLNRTRTAVMNRDKDNYRKFKRYWKLILKDEDDLNDSEFKSFICFNKLMRECDVVQYLVGLDPELQETYDLYQGLLHALKNKNPERFFRICRTEAKGVSGFMKKSVKTLLKYESYIRNALHYQWSNGVIEGTNNLIKVIKRIAFGYRSFVSFKVRILLIANTMVRFNNKRHGTFFCTMS